MTGTYQSGNVAPGRVIRVKMQSLTGHQHSFHQSVLHRHLMFENHQGDDIADASRQIGDVVMCPSKDCKGVAEIGS